MLYFLEDFLEVAIPGAIFIGILYMIFKFIKFCYRKIKLEIIGSTDGKLTCEQKKNILNIIKIFGGAQVIGLLFYATPAINENLKIIVSILITLGGFITAFFAKERVNNTILRTLIFLGQEFFGLSMLLLMVNKNMGYSITNVFVIWTAFNFFIYSQTKNIENKVFFIGTLLIGIVSLISGNISYLEGEFLVIIFAIALLAIQLFANTEDKLMKFLHNFLLTIMVILVLFAADTSGDSGAIICGTVFIYMGVTLAERLIKGEFSSKKLLIYVPYIVLLMISEFLPNLLVLFTVFNLLMSILLLADKSLYKKWLCIIILLATIAGAISCICIDLFMGIMIYLGAILFTGSYIFEVKQTIERGEWDEE